jgi:hypothetical protein
MTSSNLKFIVCLLTLLTTLGLPAMFALAHTLPRADQPASQDQDETDAEGVRLDPLLEKIRLGLTNTKFVGRFTVAGKEDQLPKQEEYTITKVVKLPKGDWWEITARIQYGDHDLTVPMQMEIKWAGETPVITVDRLTIIGLGTFDARVLLRGDQYAGTWTHDNVGGHLFGKIIKLDAQQKSETKPEPGSRPK